MKTEMDPYKDNILSALFFLMLLTSTIGQFACNSTYTHKKRGFYNIEFPEKKYQAFNKSGFPYSFEYPVYGDVVQDSAYFDTKPENDYWINVDFPHFNARIFLSYKIIGGKAPYKIKQADGSYRDSSGINSFDKMVNDAYNLTNKNLEVTPSIKDSLMRTPLGLSGIYFKVGGTAATTRQFFLSDTTRHFIRGALYFAVTPNADSLRPVVDFLNEDIAHLINTFRWKDQTGGH